MELSPSSGLELSLDGSSSVAEYDVASANFIGVCRLPGCLGGRCKPLHLR